MIIMDSKKEFIRTNELQRLEREGYPEPKKEDKRPLGATPVKKLHKTILQLKEIEKQSNILTMKRFKEAKKEKDKYEYIGNIQLKCDKLIWKKITCLHCGKTFEVC